MSWSLSAKELIKATGATTTGKFDDSFNFTGIGTDTRQDLTGKLFVALKGENYDAHQFLGAAIKAGAKGALIHERPADIDAAFPLFVVKDSLKGLQDLAHFWRKKHNFFVLGVTGSNGKTTTKEFAKAIISSAKRTYASHGSFNNHWGVPISLLSAETDSEVLIQEMGMNHKGEIATLCKIAEPNVVVCTMVGTSHIGEVGSQQDVALAKEEIYLNSPQAKFIFNLDNEFTRAMYDKHKLKKKPEELMTFSAFSNSEISLRADRLTLDGLHVVGSIAGVQGSAQVPAFGRQNVVNLMAASALALAAGLTPQQIWKALPLCQGTWGRNQWMKHASGARVLFDAYNANPESMAALLKNLYELSDSPGRRILILGEMKELGGESAPAHHRLGELSGQLSPDVVWFAGEHQADFEAGIKTSGFNKNLFLSNSYEQGLALKIGSMLNHDDIAVIKGSRSMKLEQVIESWQLVGSSQSSLKK